MFGLDTPEIGSIPEDEITTSALELEKLTTKQVKRVKERIPKEPTKTPSTIIKEVKGKKETLRTITTEVATESYARIEVFQQMDPKKYSSVSLAASELIDEGDERMIEFGGSFMVSDGEGEGPQVSTCGAFDPKKKSTNQPRKVTTHQKKKGTSSQKKSKDVYEGMVIIDLNQEKCKKIKIIC